MEGKENTEKIIDSADLNVSSQLLKQFAQQLGLQDKDKEQEDQDVEIIPEHSTGQIVLKIEEIPPLDVFYSPKHKAIIRRQRKRRKMDQDMFSTPEEEFMNIVYNNTEVNPSEDLTKLSQYAGAYSATTVDKAVEVSQMMTQKDLHIASLEEQAKESQQKITQLQQQLQDQELRSKELEEQLAEEKKKVDKKVLGKQQQLNEEISRLQGLLKIEKNAKIVQEKEFQTALDRFKYFPKLSEFKSEAL